MSTKSYRRDPLFTVHPTQGSISDEYSHRAFIMYHGTQPEALTNILQQGFKKSENKCMLGSGIYASRDPEKTLNYGPVTLKLVVYSGKVQIVDKQRHPQQRCWQDSHDSAWVPANCGMVKSNREETCFKEPWQVKVLGVSRGYSLLEMNVKRKIQSVKEDYESKAEKVIIGSFKSQLKKQRQQVEEQQEATSTFFERQHRKLQHQQQLKREQLQQQQRLQMQQIQQQQQQQAVQHVQKRQELEQKQKKLQQQQQLEQQQLLQQHWLQQEHLKQQQKQQFPDLLQIFDKVMRLGLQKVYQSSHQLQYQELYDRQLLERAQLHRQQQQQMQQIHQLQQQQAVQQVQSRRDLQKKQQELQQRQQSEYQQLLLQQQLQQVKQQ